MKIGDGTHKRLANVPFRITSKTTGESHIIVTDANGQFSTAADWVSHTQNTNVAKTVRTVSGSVLPHQTTAKVRCSTIPIQSRNYAVIPTKE